MPSASSSLRQKNSSSTLDDRSMPFDRRPIWGFSQYVGGGGCAVRNMPRSVPPEQRRLLLTSGDGNPELFILSHAERGGGEVVENAGDFIVIDRSALYEAGGARLLAIRKELKCAHAIPTHGCK